MVWDLHLEWRQDNPRAFALESQQGSVALVPKDTWAGPAPSHHISQCSQKGFRSVLLLSIPSLKSPCRHTLLPSISPGWFVGLGFRAVTWAQVQHSCLLLLQERAQQRQHTQDSHSPAHLTAKPWVGRSGPKGLGRSSARAPAHSCLRLGSQGKSTTPGDARD